MKIYEQHSGEDVVDALTRTVEQNSGKEIFTLRLLDENQIEESIEAIIVFKDRSVLRGKIGIQTIEGKLAVRVQANYI